MKWNIMFSFLFLPASIFLSVSVSFKWNGILNVLHILENIKNVCINGKMAMTMIMEITILFRFVPIINPNQLNWRRWKRNMINKIKIQWFLNVLFFFFRFIQLFLPSSWFSFAIYRFRKINFQSNLFKWQNGPFNWKLNVDGFVVWLLGIGYSNIQLKTHKKLIQ